MDAGIELTFWGVGKNASSSFLMVSKKTCLTGSPSFGVQYPHFMKMPFVNTIGVNLYVTMALGCSK